MKKPYALKKVFNPFNYLGPRGEINVKPSKTVPSSGLSLQDLINRYTRGQLIPVSQPVYNGETDFPDITRLDPVERLELAREIREGYILQTQQRLADERAAAEAKRNDPATIFNETGEPVKQG